VKITVAMLADQALAHPDGKLYITGGGIRSLNVTTLPARYGQLALALQLVFGPDEVGNQHRSRRWSVDWTLTA